VGLRDEPGYPDLPTFEGTPAREYFEKFVAFVDGVNERGATAIVSRAKSAIQTTSAITAAVVAAQARITALQQQETALDRATADASAAAQRLEDAITQYNATINPPPARGDA